MNHADHVRLLRGGLAAPGGVWGDFGSGAGAFTLALAELIGSTGVIYSIDQDRSALAQQERALREHYPQVSLHPLAADFTRPLQLPLLDGLVMANSLHFVREKDRTLQLLKSYLKPGGRFVLVEYNVDSGNLWVPYPISFASWQLSAQRNGFVETRLLDTQPSRFLKEIYSAVSH